jgi:hypothetical protein
MADYRKLESSFSVKLNDGEDHDVTIELDGYEKEIVLMALRKYQLYLMVEEIEREEDLKESNPDDWQNSPELYGVIEWHARTGVLLHRLKKEFNS